MRPPLRTPALTVVALALASCPSSPTPRPSATPTPSVVRGGEIRVAYPWEPPTLNPFLRGGDAPATRELVRPMLPALYRLGPGGTRVPWLLEREPSGADVGDVPFSVRLRLRPDARWSDGRPITASDVRFTWRTIMDRRWPVASRDGYDRITDVVVESERVARVVFAGPFLRWRDLFSAGLGVLPEHALGGKNFSKELSGAWPVSGGPFSLASYTPGLELVYARNPSAWGGAPLVDRVRVLFVPDPTTAIQLFRRGDVDVLGPYSAPDFARRVSEDPDARVTRDAGATWVGLALNTSHPALSDARVRLALVRAIDRAAIVEGLVRDEGVAHEDGFVAPAQPGAFAALDADTGAATALLEEAGFRAGRDGIRRRAGTELGFTIASIASDELADRVLRAVHGQTRALGFDPNLVGVDADEFWSEWMQGSRFEAALAWMADPPGGAARARYASGFVPPAGINYSRLRSKALDRALGEADGLGDAGLALVAELLAEAVPVIPLYRVRVTAAARRDIHGVEANASADGFLASAHAWWREGGASPAAAGASRVEGVRRLLSFPSRQPAGVLELADRHG